MTCNFFLEQAHPRRVARVAKQIEREVGSLLLHDRVSSCICTDTHGSALDACTLLSIMQRLTRKIGRLLAQQSKSAADGCAGATRGSLPGSEAWAG